MNPWTLNTALFRGKPVVKDGCVPNLDEAELVANVQEGVAALDQKSVEYEIL
ncbi:hypothetical protein P4S72_14985 [Vibrio sp. PP-XX7]